MVIIHLYEQRDAVSDCIRGLPADSKKQWLEQRGELTEIHVTDPAPTIHVFRSHTGIETKFFFDGNRLVFLGDHTTLGAIE
ncbi:MAG: hypothetical protein AAF497_02800 [Planctomycetota bacterium]